MNKDLDIRTARESDIERIVHMYECSREMMTQMGNPTQWVGYPTIDNAKSDVANGVAYMVCKNERAVGTFVLIPGKEPMYARIERGQWIEDEQPYATIHRIACNFSEKGVGEKVFRYAKTHYERVRVDTHKDNAPMLHVIDKEDFVYAGIVFMPNGDERMAYQWWRYDEVREEIKRYIEDEVFPQYDSFDSAHRREHARRVVAQAMALARHYDVDAEMVYVAAAMHDVGLKEGREEHHQVSARIIREDERLRQWFSEEQITVIATAAKEHRASQKDIPQTIYGKIVAEADRDIDPMRIIRRTIEYGMTHYSNMDKEQHFSRMEEHLREKYGVGGYMRLWLPESSNRENLKSLRSIIADKPLLRRLFEEIYSENVAKK